MIDTISFNIFACPDAIASLSSLISTRFVVSNSNGIIESEFTAGSLEGSFDYRVRLAVKDKQWLSELEFYTYHVAGKPISNYKKSKIPVHLETPQYLTVELSLPKWACGVNFLPMTWEEDRTNLEKFRVWLSELAGHDLPSLNQWLVNRIDLAQCYQLGCEEEVMEHIVQLKNSEYIRRSGAWRPTGVYFSGSTTTVKLYAKYKEIAVHDKRRLRTYLGREYTERIHSLSKGLLRFEVEFKKRFLNDRGLHVITEIFDKSSLMEDIMIIELKKMYGGLDNKKVNSLNDLIALINSQDWHGTGVSAGTMVAVLSVWSAQGRSEALNQFGRNMFYRVLHLANDRGLGLVKGLDEIKNKKLSEPCKTLYLADYPKVSNKIKDAYELFLIAAAG
jgi:hypothetical protein